MPECHWWLAFAASPIQPLAEKIGYTERTMKNSAPIPNPNVQRLVDLREILRYVPQYRDKIFVIAFDGAVVEDDNFRNLLLDIALLRSLRIGVVAGPRRRAIRFASSPKQTGKTPSNIDGTGVTDAATLQLALTAANRVTHEILEGLSATDLRGACTNAVVAHPAGILQGVDQQHTGRVERVDVALLKALLEQRHHPGHPAAGLRRRRQDLSPQLRRRRRRGGPRAAGRQADLPDDHRRHHVATQRPAAGTA